VMGARPAVGVIHRRALAAAANPEAERERLADAYARDQLRPEVAASTGYVDGLIEPWESRDRLVWAFGTLGGRR
jgi:propionyl-CoA carboxylase beta chain